MTLPLWTYMAIAYYVVKVPVKFQSMFILSVHQQSYFSWAAKLKAIYLAVLLYFNHSPVHVRTYSLLVAVHGPGFRFLDDRRKTAPGFRHLSPSLYKEYV